MLLEVWAAGTVVLASRTSGAEVLVEHGRNGWLFDLEELQTFHQALSQALDNRHLASQMAARGAEKVRNDYSVTALARRMKTLYEELIEQKQCTT